MFLGSYGKPDRILVYPGRLMREKGIRREAIAIQAIA